MLDGLPRRPLGRTGVEVSALGLGGGPIGAPTLADEVVDRLVGTAIELGITLIDTARSYGCCEARLGRLGVARRHDVLVSTKLGYGVEGCADWTAAAVTKGVEEALRTLDTDAIDVVFLHSCSAEVLRRGDVVAALGAARDAGKVRFIGYAGDNQELAVAVGLGVFDVVETSVSALDGWSLENQIGEAAGAGIGVIAKRVLANAPWRFERRPEAADLGIYWDRWHARPELHADHAQAFLRYAAWAPGVGAALVGTSSPERLRAHVEAVCTGPLPDEQVDRIRAGSTGGGSWPGVI